MLVDEDVGRFVVCLSFDDCGDFARCCEEVNHHWQIAVIVDEFLQLGDKFGCFHGLLVFGVAFV